jgi:DNA repair exonuclease SbcCD ATPase subunit
MIRHKYPTEWERRDFAPRAPEPEKTEADTLREEIERLRDALDDARSRVEGYDRENNDLRRLLAARNELLAKSSSQREAELLQEALVLEQNWQKATSQLGGAKGSLGAMRNRYTAAKARIAELEWILSQRGGPVS